MPVLTLAALLALAPQSPGQPTRDILMGVCVPFVATGASPDDNIALSGLTAAAGGEGQDYQSANGHHLVRLTTSGDAEEGTVRRTCVVQARIGGFEQARDAVAGPLRSAGFALTPDEPEDYPVWTRGGVTVSAHQNPGRATIIRVSYSMLDEEG